MASPNPTRRKASDEDIIRLNSVGLSLGTIGDLLGVHTTTITTRLAAMGIAPSDTRRSFMEGVYWELTREQQEWLKDQLGPHYSIKQFVTNLLVKEFFARNSTSEHASEAA